MNKSIFVVLGILVVGSTIGTTLLLLNKGDTNERKMCELCIKPLVVGKEVFLFDGVGKKHTYRCIHCALTAQFENYTTSKVLAKSGIYGQAIVVERSGGKWTVIPQTTVFLTLPEKSGECIDRHQAFVTEEEFDEYLNKYTYLRNETEKIEKYTINDIETILEAGKEIHEEENKSAKIKIEVAGFITHLPMQSTVSAIKSVVARYGDNVSVTWYDESTPRGKEFLEEKGLSGHIPLAIFINGETTFEIDGKSVTFQNFEGEKWTREDLDKVINEKLNEKL